MEKFKKKLKKRIVFGSVYCGLIPLLAIALHFCVGETLSSGFTLGFACGIAAVSLVFVIQSAQALCSDEKLRKCISQKRMSETNISKIDVPLPASVSSWRRYRWRP